MAKVLFVIALVVIPGFAMADSFFCLKPAAGVKASKMQFTFPSDGHVEGFVRYKTAKENIKVKRGKETELKKSGDRPSLTETEWIELPENSTSGRYSIVSQGAVVESLEYRSQSKGKAKVIKFVSDLESVGDESCLWNK